MTFDFTEENNGTTGGHSDEGGCKPSGSYRVSLSVFEGPIDLLLYLIRKNELDIHEISLAKVAQEYLEYVELIKLIDLERAGEFIVIASTLMKMKARSLYAQKGKDGEEGDADETKNELIRYLLEYQKLGGAADKLAEKESERQGIYPRGGEKQRVVDSTDEKPPISDYALFDLMSALKDVLKSTPKIKQHEVKLLNINSAVKRREIMAELREKGKLVFHEYVAGEPRLVVVVTFIAILELIKMRRIHIRQNTHFGYITIYERTDNESADN